MNRRKPGSVLFFASFLVSSVLAAFAGPEPAVAGAESYFPNVVLTTHDNKTVRFYDDLVKGKVVLINFMFTSCKRFCPVTTPNLVRVRAALGDRMGRATFLYSYSRDPEIGHRELTET